MRLADVMRSEHRRQLGRQSCSPYRAFSPKDFLSPEKGWKKMGRTLTLLAVVAVPGRGPASRCGISMIYRPPSILTY